MNKYVFILSVFLSASAWGVEGFHYERFDHEIFTVEEAQKHLEEISKEAKEQQELIAKNRKLANKAAADEQKKLKKEHANCQSDAACIRVVQEKSRQVYANLQSTHKKLDGDTTKVRQGRQHLEKVLYTGALLGGLRDQTQNLEKNKKLELNGPMITETLGARETNDATDFRNFVERNCKLNKLALYELEQSSTAAMQAVTMHYRWGERYEIEYVAFVNVAPGANFALRIEGADKNTPFKFEETDVAMALEHGLDLGISDYKFEHERGLFVCAFEKIDLEPVTSEESDSCSREGYSLSRVFAL